MVTTRTIPLETKGHNDIADITSLVRKAVSASGITNGIVTLFLPGSTAGLTTIENEPGLIYDFKEIWERLVPASIPYRHNQAWGEGNGYAHVRASLLGASLTIPLVNGNLTLGTWQQIVLVDFDSRPRSREVMLQTIGE